MSDPVAETRTGAVRGYDNDGISVFKGIPYGAPTGGAARFRRPGPAAPWSGVRDATQLGPSSPQMFGINLPSFDRPAFLDVFGLSDPPDTNQSEDCLVLNVWTPGIADGGARPVLFRIHGGGYRAGSGSWNWHEGTNTARRGDAVVVTVNHRLSPVGYLYLDEIGGPEYAGSGNAGMLDLVLALEWVRDNIEAFGGDPGRVMIFGESGGGMKVSTLLAMPSAAGLFHTAIVQSGPALRATTPEAATKTAEAYLDALGVGTGALERLGELPLQQLLDVNTELSARAGATGVGMMSPVVDGTSLPAHPGDALAAGASADVPLMVGSTRHEMLMFLALVRGGLPDLDAAAVRERLLPMLGDRTDEVIAVFERSNPEASGTELFATIQSAASMGMGSIRLAERKLAGGTAPVYMYLLTWRSPFDGGKYGAPHGMCVPLSMDNCWSAQWSDVPEARGVAARMNQAWIDLAAVGDPNHADLPKWAPYSLDERATMFFDDPCVVVDDPFPEERAVLDGVPGMFG